MLTTQGKVEQTPFFSPTPQCHWAMFLSPAYCLFSLLSSPDRGHSLSKPTLDSVQTHSCLQPCYLTRPSRDQNETVPEACAWGSPLLTLLHSQLLVRLLLFMEEFFKNVSSQADLKGKAGGEEKDSALRI